MASLRNRFAHAVFLAASLLVGGAEAAQIQITIDTAALGLNTSNWDLAFDLTDNDLNAPNSVTITGFVITGGALTANVPFYPSSGNVTGDLATDPPGVTLDDSNPASNFFNEYSQNANIGTAIAFVIDITANQTAGVLFPDAFAFFFIDPATGLPFPTADPTGAVFVYSIGNPDQPETFCPQVQCVTATPIATDVPEPGALALVLTGLFATSAARKRASRRRSTT